MDFGGVEYFFELGHDDLLIEKVKKLPSTHIPIESPLWGVGEDVVYARSGELQNLPAHRIRPGLATS
jgi:hypothetical protein